MGQSNCTQKKYTAFPGQLSKGRRMRRRISKFNIIKVGNGMPKKNFNLSDEDLKCSCKGHNLDKLL